MTTLAMQYEKGSLADDFVRVALWLLLAPLFFLLGELLQMAKNWRLVLLAASIVGTVMLCLMQPLLPVGFLIVGIYAVLTKPKGKGA